MGKVTTANRQRPRIEADSAEFWEGVRRRQLVVQKCDECSSLRFYPGAVCRECWAPGYDWVPVSGVGEVYSVTRVHVAPGPEFQAKAPYYVGLIDLDEGVRMMGNVSCSRDGEIKVGARVEVWFEEVDAGAVLPQWQVVDK